MVRNNFMMHICTVATLCFPEKTVPRNYYYCVQDDNSLSLCFKSMYRTLFVAIFTSTFIFSMFKSFHTYRNINISNRTPVENWCLLSPHLTFYGRRPKSLWTCSVLPKTTTLSLKGGATANLGIGLLSMSSIISISDP